MLRIWIAGAPSSFKVSLGTFFLLAIALLYLIIPGIGAQSVIINKNTRRSNHLDKDKGV